MQPINLTKKSLKCIAIKYVVGKIALVFKNDVTTNSSSHYYYIYINYLLDYIPEHEILETFLEDFKDETFDVLVSNYTFAKLDVLSEGIVKKYFETMKNEC